MIRHSFVRAGLQSHLLPVSSRSFSSTPSVHNFWKSVSESTPVHYMQEGLIQLHDLSGLPWWATIMLSTVALRTVVTLPMTIYQFKIMGRIEKIGHEMPALLEELKKETDYAVKKFGWSEKHAQFMFAKSARKQWQKLYVRDNCHPAKTAITIWFQIPLWIVQSIAIRNIISCLPDPSSIQAQMRFVELTVGGFGWIPNLTEVDSSLILPVTLGVVNLAIIQIQTSLRKDGPVSKLSSILTNVFRVFSVLMVPIAATVPSCLCLYWVTSSTYGLAQNLALVSPKVREILGVPHLKHMPKEKPYQYLVEKLLYRKK